MLVLLNDFFLRIWGYSADNMILIHLNLKKSILSQFMSSKPIKHPYFEFIYSDCAIWFFE